MKLLENLRYSIEKNGLEILRYSVGIVFVWFGALKYFPNSSSAEGLAERTIDWITFGILHHQAALFLLATIECTVGIFLMLKKALNVIIPLLYFQLLGTILPLFVFTNETWKKFLLVPTLEGQYIIKNIVLIAAAIIMGAIAKGGKLIVDREVADKADKEESKKRETSE